MRKFLLVLALLAANSASAFWPFARAAVRQVADVQLARNFYRARYLETCENAATTAPQPHWCYGFGPPMDALDKHLREANDALLLVKEAQAKMPLQLDLIYRDLKAVKKAYGGP